MRGSKTRSASAAVAAALLMISSVSRAQPVLVPSAAASAQVSQNSWLALSMLTPTGTIGLAGAAAQSGRPDDAPPPPPPPPAYGTVQTPPIPVIAIWLGTLAMAVYIISIHEHGHGQFPTPPPVSPA